jgi:uncharacterized protein YdeI (YjbR/CyaY-like superfamily)
MEPTFFESQQEFRAWLEANHASKTELWVGFYKKAAGKDGLTYQQALDEALCFGWIDGLVRSLGDEARAQRWTPRRKRSNWSNINIKRFRELEAEGRVAPAGRAAFEARPIDGTGYSFEQGEAALEERHLEAFKADSAAWTYWETCPPGYKRIAIWWVVSARRQETRDKRFQVLLDCCRAAERIPLLRREPSK